MPMQRIFAILSRVLGVFSSGALVSRKIRRSTHTEISGVRFAIHQRWLPKIFEVEAS